MFKILSGIIAAMALLSATATLAAGIQPQRCLKAAIAFACHKGGNGKTTRPCRAGETETQCCARLKKQALHPRQGLCAGLKGGVRAFTCACSGKIGHAAASRRGAASPA